MVNSRGVISPRRRELQGSTSQLTADGSMEPSACDHDESLPSQLFLTPHLPEADLRNYADSAPRLSRRKRTGERDDVIGNVSASAPRTASVYEELNLDLSPIRALSFDDEEFILALPCEIGMISRGTSFDHDESESNSTNPMDYLPWNASITVSMESHETCTHSFRPIRDFCLETDDEIEGAFDLPTKHPRAGFRLHPRRSRCDDASATICMPHFR